MKNQYLAGIFRHSTNWKSPIARPPKKNNNKQTKNKQQQQQQQQQKQQKHKKCKTKQNKTTKASKLCISKPFWSSHSKGLIMQKTFPWQNVIMLHIHAYAYIVSCIGTRYINGVRRTAVVSYQCFSDWFNGEKNTYTKQKQYGLSHGDSAVMLPGPVFYLLSWSPSHLKFCLQVT